MGIESFLGGGVQPEGNQSARANSGIVKTIFDKFQNKNSTNQGQANQNSPMMQAYDAQAMGNTIGTQKSPGKINLITDNNFYGHMTVPSCRKDVPTIGNAGKAFNKITKEDKAFNRSSNFSDKKGDCKKAR